MTFESRVLLLLDWLLYQGWKTRSALLFTRSWRVNNWIHNLSRGNVKCDQFRPGFELVLSCPFPTMITITPRAHHSFLYSYLIQIVFKRSIWLNMVQSGFSSKYMEIVHHSPRWPSRLGLQNTPTSSLQKGKTTPTSVLDMTLNNLMIVMLELWGMWSINL